MSVRLLLQVSLRASVSVSVKGCWRIYAIVCVSISVSIFVSVWVSLWVFVWETVGASMPVSELCLCEHLYVCMSVLQVSLRMSVRVSLWLSMCVSEWMSVWVSMCVSVQASVWVLEWACVCVYECFCVYVWMLERFTCVCVCESHCLLVFETNDCMRWRWKVNQGFFYHSIAQSIMTTTIQLCMKNIR